MEKPTATTDCSFCATEGAAVAAAATCAMCGRPACAYTDNPDQRIFHSEVCACGCGGFVCREDFARHSRGHGPGRAPSICFPVATAISAAGTLAIIEECAAAPREEPLRATDVAHLCDFLVHIAATLDYVHAGVRRVERSRSLPACQVPARLASILRDPLRRLLLAPVAFNNVRVAWTHTPAREQLRGHFAGVAERVDRMVDALSPIRPLRDPMVPAAISAYAELSPRLAAGLRAALEIPALPRFRSPLDLHPFFSLALPEGRATGSQDAWNVRIEPTLSAHLPRRSTDCAG